MGISEIENIESYICNTDGKYTKQIGVTNRF